MRGATSITSKNPSETRTPVIRTGSWLVRLASYLAPRSQLLQGPHVAAVIPELELRHGVVGRLVPEVHHRLRMGKRPRGQEHTVHHAEDRVGADLYIGRAPALAGDPALGVLQDVLAEAVAVAVPGGQHGEEEVFARPEVGSLVGGRGRPRSEG